MPNLTVAFVSCMMLLTRAVGTADVIVVPNASTSAVGNNNIGAPTTPIPGITQELFASSQFTLPIEITQISEREAPGTGGANFIYGGLNLYLSYSPNSPNSSSGPLMTSTFVNNIGASDTLVFSGNVTLSDAGCSGAGPCPFDLSLHLTTPFYYNPAFGSLLLEAIFTSLYNPSGNSYLDGAAFNSPGGQVAEVYEFGSATATTGTFIYGGPIIQFSTSSVPEPGSLTLLGLGLAGAAVFWRRRSIGK